jgi:hypothetical protein
VTGPSVVRGLGRVTLTEFQRIDDPGFKVRLEGMLSVAGKGELTYVADNSAHPMRPIYDFTITGGTGRLAGASGSGQIQWALTQRYSATWAGVLDVPGLEFDTTRPTVALTATDAHCRANGRCVVRMTYRARDDLPGPLAVRIALSPGTVRRVGPAGGTVSLTIKLRRPPATIRVSVTVTDSSGNSTTRTVAVRPRTG